MRRGGLRTAMDTTNPGSADAPGWFRTRSLEQAIHRCEIAFHPHRLRLLGRPEEFGYTQRRTQAGPITVAHLSYDSDVWLDFGDSRDSYYIHIPLSGHLESRYRGQELIATPSLASVYGPAADITVTRWPAGSRHLGVKIDQLALDSALERLLGRSVDSPVEFGATLPVRPGAVQSWVRQLLWMSGELAYPGNPMRQSAALDPLVESVIYGFILMACQARRAGAPGSCPRRDGHHRGRAPGVADDRAPGGPVPRQRPCTAGGVPPASRDDADELCADDPASPCAPRFTRRTCCPCQRRSHRTPLGIQSPRSLRRGLQGDVRRNTAANPARWHRLATARSRAGVAGCGRAPAARGCSPGPRPDRATGSR
jgi:hypothetical protein